MAEEEEGEAGGHHVLLLPGPMQGNVNSMMKLAPSSSASLPHHLSHHRFHPPPPPPFRRHPLSFTNLPQPRDQDHLRCLPDDHPRSDRNALADLYSSMNSHAKPLIRDIILSQTAAKPKITCLIGDGFFGGLTADVADEVGIPVIHFRAISASCFWALFCAPNLFESNELPIRGEEDMDRIIATLPGMENILRCRDLPGFFRGTETNLVDPLKSTVFDCHQTLRARGVILNTFEDLDGPLLTQMRLKFLRVFAVGSLHAHLNYRRVSDAKTTPSTSSFWEEDRSCLTWLDSQPLKSVLYVSFGSITTVTRERLMEFWYGLVNSKKRFLWVIRPDMVAGADNDERVAAELEEGTKERGFIVGWAPQEEVLAHKAIGGFLTHSGWNSTLESLVAGVPMICWPCFADQQINSRFVSEVWKLGLDMKDLCDRDVVEKMVNDLMVHRREEFLKSAQAMATLADKSVSPGGSSYSSLHDLVEFIKSASRKIN
ncbi:7-deoxyloganetic acid glucosyltransferase-like [Vigna angularis]|uniref:Glycosyltransferase n=1 Tax=Phaseolus angularis TaxID=3914 RepID=Q8S9A7_PHAAN|nr:7-deoxyloganetic acid glucosyltransferase-like [Vigna angularis]BAB86920.1 glucosyltransferase-2 [Vigna angularis]